MFFKCKSHLKEADDFKGVYINEDLTRHRADLLRSARQLVKIKSLSAWSLMAESLWSFHTAPNVKLKEDLGAIQWFIQNIGS